MKKVLSIFLSVLMCVALFTACGSKDDTAEAGSSTYSGILTKVKLGMPLTKIISLQPDGIDLYYQDDTTVWSINPDTDLMEIAALIPEDNAFYYADDSIITYYFKTVKGDEEIYLNSYSEEVHCLIDRTSAENYFNTKSEQLVKKHCINDGSSATASMTGTEGVDMTLVYTQNISTSSYTVDFSMTLTYDTVDGVEGYYGTMFEITLTEKAVKDSVAIDSPQPEDKE